MSAVTRPTGPGNGAMTALGLVILAVGAAVLLPTFATGINTGTMNFVSPVDAIMSGSPWTPAHTFVAIAAAVVIVGLAVGAIVANVREARRSAPADKAIPYLGKGREIAPLMPPALAKKHKRMGLDPKRFPGMVVGHTVAGMVPLRASYEDTITVIAGPRRNKSAAIVIPNILAAPGVCLVTSVRPDVLVTAGHRATLGSVLAYDPQEIAVGYESLRAWWNPLKRIRTLNDAEKLTAVFAATAYGDPEKSGDNPFFSKNGSDLIARYILAAALDGQYLPVVYDWLNRYDDPTPRRILEAQAPELADSVRSLQGLVEETRSGVYGWALAAMGFLGNTQMRRWLIPIVGAPEIDPINLVRSGHDTLYLLSREEKSGAAPLVGALTQAILDASETEAVAAGGRLRIPLVAILDEAANIVKIPELPRKYSFYGGMGIVVITILQSQPQGEETWGKNGFQALWSASTVQVFAGGNISADFGRELSELIGDYHYYDTSTTSRAGGGSSQRTRRTERIFDPSDLRALTLGRAIVLAQGCRPVLVKAVPWFDDKTQRDMLNLPAPVLAQARREFEEEAPIAA